MCRIHGLVDRYSGRSMVDSQPGQGGAPIGVLCAAAMEGRSSPQLPQHGERVMVVLTEAMGDSRAAELDRAMKNCGGG
jgi:hypothetical protein